MTYADEMTQNELIQVQQNRC